LLRFGEEELKHQQLFLRAEAVLEASCGYTFGRYFDRKKERVTAFTKGAIITADQVMMEVGPFTGEKRSLCFHADCFQLWNVERHTKHS